MSVMGRGGRRQRCVQHRSGWGSLLWGDTVPLPRVNLHAHGTSTAVKFSNVQRFVIPKIATSYLRHFYITWLGFLWLHPLCWWTLQPRAEWSLKPSIIQGLYLIFEMKSVLNPVVKLESNWWVCTSLRSLPCLLGIFFRHHQLTLLFLYSCLFSHFMSSLALKWHILTHK